MLIGCLLLLNFGVLFRFVVCFALLCFDCVVIAIILCFSVYNSVVWFLLMLCISSYCFRFVCEFALSVVCWTCLGFCFVLVILVDCFCLMFVVLFAGLCVGLHSLWCLFSGFGVFLLFALWLQCLFWCLLGVAVGYWFTFDGLWFMVLNSVAYSDFVIFCC